jgi:ketosteroid isomerase-like protein
MSEHLDLVRSIYADWERGDYSRTDWAHPEIEWEYAADGPTPRGGTGLAGMAKDWRGYIGEFEEVRHKADEYLELDGERVLVLHHYRGHGKASGLDLEQFGWGGGGAVVFHIRDGRVTRLVGYFERANALADLGLEG